MPAPAAVAVDDDLAPGQAGVAFRTANDETARRIDQEFGRVGQHFVRQNFADHFFDKETANLGVLHVPGVLGGNDNVGDADRLAVFVND